VGVPQRVWKISGNFSVLQEWSPCFCLIFLVYVCKCTFANVHSLYLKCLHLLKNAYRQLLPIMMITICDDHHQCDHIMITLVVNNLLAIWRHFCLHEPICQRRLWERLFKGRFINGLIYLLQLLLWHCWLVITKSIQPVKTEWWGAGIVVRSELQMIAYGPPDATATSSSLVSLKSRLV